MDWTQRGGKSKHISRRMYDMELPRRRQRWNTKEEICECGDGGQVGWCDRGRFGRIINWSKRTEESFRSLFYVGMI